MDVISKDHFGYWGVDPEKLRSRIASVLRSIGASNSTPIQYIKKKSDGDEIETSIRLWRIPARQVTEKAKEIL